MRLPHPPAGATRFFARPLAGLLECPRCGQVLSFSSTAHPGWKSTKGWNPHTGRLQCWACKYTFVLGLIAWPVRSAGPKARTVPRDQVPNERQLVQMRNMSELGGSGAGWWMPKDQALTPHRPEHSNITAGCTCPERSDGGPDLSRRDRACPSHGDQVEEVEGWETKGDR